MKVEVVSSSLIFFSHSHPVIVVCIVAVVKASKKMTQVTVVLVSSQGGVRTDIGLSYVGTYVCSDSTTLYVVPWLNPAFVSTVHAAILC